MRQSVIELINMGPLPSEDCNDITLIEKYQALLHSIEPPLSIKEAKSLVSVFGDDECYELAWTLLHLIESADKLNPEDITDRPENLWVKRLKTRALNLKNNFK
ncbi:TPA: hypothetical protein N2F65_003905 [Salmonella enterica]|nr:hypothetical protein [Salmonella enterica]EBG5297225.1 hypothetical protein [Salmonella enterica subsp. enterica]EEE2004575.1 hypothetical protein [Salmonella enterica subsp. enterica serovar Kotte]EEF3252888.1 hypothetical protein [Salmonella enterica subsp. enterica serovar Abony]EDT2963559.1 hypothetical protein [Salmonella enterica subsp. enterica]